MALFIVFEGIDGAGKSTQIELLRRKLVAVGHSPLVTLEPGGTPLGEQAGPWLKRLEDLSPLTELLLFNAVRAEHVSKVIQPSLDQGRIILCDRFTASTIAYQAYGRGLDLKTVESINRLATGGLQPTQTVFLDLPPEETRARKQADTLDEIEKQNLNFYRRVRQGYLIQSANNPKTWVMVDGTLPTEEIAEKIWAQIHPLL